MQHESYSHSVKRNCPTGYKGLKENTVNHKQEILKS